MDKRQHNVGCDCYECAIGPVMGTNDYLNELFLKGNKANYIDATGRVDYADAGAKPASYYLDSVLVARKPVNLMSGARDDAKVLQSFPKGANVGRIYSYVVTNGQVWWSVDWFSGSHAGWVKHQPGLFDTEIAEQTSSGAKQEASHEQYLKDKAALDAINPVNIVTSIATGASKAVTGIADVIGGAGDTIGSLGKNLKWIIIGIVVIGLIMLYFKYGKSTA